MLGGDGFGDELGEGVLPPLEDLPTFSGLDVTLEPLGKEETKSDEIETDKKMETGENKIADDIDNNEATEAGKTKHMLLYLTNLQ